MCVGATDRTDELASFSNDGEKTVDMAAPGVGIASTVRDGDWTLDDGTSMAAPHVAGAAALMLSENPDLTPWQVTTMLVDSATPVAALNGKVAANGRLDVDAAIDATAPDPSGQPTYLSTIPQPVIVPTSTIEAVPTAATPATTSSAPSTTRTTTPSTPATDRLAPALGLSLTTRGALRSALAGRLKARATCSERCSLKVDLYVDVRTARSLRIARGAAVIGSGTATLAHAGQAAVTVRLTGAARRAAAHEKRSLKAKLRATATDTSGNRRTRERSVTLRR